MYMWEAIERDVFRKGYVFGWSKSMIDAMENCKSKHPEALDFEKYPEPREIPGVYMPVSAMLKLKGREK